MLRQRVVYVKRLNPVSLDGTMANAQSTGAAAIFIAFSHAQIIRPDGQPRDGF